MLKSRHAAENINPRIASRSNKTINPTLTVCLITFGVPSGGAPSAIFGRQLFNIANSIENRLTIVNIRMGSCDSSVRTGELYLIEI